MAPKENWKAIFDLNVLALNICTKEAIQSMQDGKVDDGHIVHNNPLNTKLRLLYLKTQFVPRSKHF
jgi:hypothetical protein